MTFTYSGDPSTSTRNYVRFLLNDTDSTDVLFSDEELETLANIKVKFANMSTWDIVDLSHLEKAWKELEANRELIGYQDYAFELAMAIN